MGSPTPSPALSENGLIAILAHETSHLYGLGERYIEFPCACNSGEKTVMSGGTLVIGLQDHCDGITGLEPIYDDRVTDYYIDGGIANFTATASGSVGTYMGG